MKKEPVPLLLFILQPSSLILLLCAGVASAQSTDAISEIVIECEKPLQRIDGFGSSTFGGFELFERGHFDDVVPVGVTYHTTPQQRRDMINTLVRELGLTHARIWLWPGTEPQNDNDDPDVINWEAFDWLGQSGKPQGKSQGDNRMNGLKEWGDFLTVAVPLGLSHWIVTPGELPDWLAKRINDPHDARRFDEYAEWAAANLLYLKKTFGLEAPYWSMFNEPDANGHHWTDPDEWRVWLKATGARFRHEGLKTKIMFPDFMNVHRAVEVTEKVLKDDEARGYIGALAYHHYRSSGDGPQPFLKVTAATQPASTQTADSGELFDKLTRGARRMAELGRQYGLPSWQTETAYYPRNVAPLTEWEIGRGRANEIYYELLSGASAVEGMLAIWVDAIDPRYNTTVRHEGHHIVMTTDGKNVTHWGVTKDAGVIFGHYSRFVRPGDHCLAAKCADPMLRVTAFRTRSADIRRSDCDGQGLQDSGCIVAVVVNNATEPKHVTLHLANQPWKPRQASSLMTDESRTLVCHGVTPLRKASDRYESNLPALSVTTFVWSAAALPRLTLPKDVSLR